jgi:hypothetical protein
MKALLDFYESLIFQGVRGDVFKSAILHFLAVLGIDEEINRLRQANDFSIYASRRRVLCARISYRNHLTVYRKGRSERGR